VINIGLPRIAGQEQVRANAKRSKFNVHSQRYT